MNSTQCFHAASLCKLCVPQHGLAAASNALCGGRSVPDTPSALDACPPAGLYLPCSSYYLFPTEAVQSFLSRLLRHRLHLWCSLVPLSRLRQLERLDVGWCSGLGDSDAAVLARFTRLRELNLARTQVRVCVCTSVHSVYL